MVFDPFISLSLASIVSGALEKIPNSGIIIPNMGTKQRNRSKGSPASGLADALFTATQQRVLALLFGQPERTFYVTEILKLAKSGRGAVQRELKRLQEGGLIVSSREGNRKHYQANAASPLFEELCRIVTKTVGLKTPITDALEPLRDRITLALVYGSVAKGTDKASSDVDLLIVSDTLTLEEIYQALEPTEATLDRKINPTLYTSQEFDERRASKSNFITRVLQGPHLLIVGDPGEW